MRLPVTLVRSLLRAYSVASKHNVAMPKFEFKPDVILSESNRKACIERFKSHRLMQLIQVEDLPQAAVLIPLCIYKGKFGILYTLRSMKLSSNRGQVSFPGGMHDECDTNLEETALRETWEELKIPKEKVDVWAAGKMLFKTDVNVMPVLAYIGEVEPEQLEINPDEVEEAFVVTLEELCDTKLHGYTRFQQFSLSLPSYMGGKHRIWGFTGIITHIVLECLLPNVYKHKIQQVEFLRKNTTSTEMESTKHSTKDKQTITRSKI